MAALPVIIDDQDISRLDYKGSWSRSGSEINFSRTLVSSKASGDTMTFVFNGTSVSVVGTYDIGGSCNATFSLDGVQKTVSSPKITTAQNHEPLYTSPTLADGEHTLVYSVTSCTSDTTSSSGLMIWLDYILFTPTTPPIGTSRYFIDDSDDRVDYSGSWVSQGENSDFAHTKHGGKKGDSLTYVFYGSSISVHGRVGNSTGSPTQGSFTIDGGSPGSFSTPPQDKITYNRELYISGDLERGNHTLVVNSLSDTPLWIDYLLVEDVVETAKPSHAPSSNGGGKLQMGTITGIAVGGGCAVLAITLVLLFLYFKRWRHGRSSRPRIKANNSDMNGGLPWTSTKLHQYPPSSPGPSTLSFSPSAKSTTPLVATGSGYSTPIHIRSPSDIHSRSHHQRSNTATSRTSSPGSERRYQTRVPLRLADEDVTYTLSGIHRTQREDFPRSVHGHGDAMSDASSESRGRRYSRSSSSNHYSGSRSRLRNISNPDEDIDSVAILKQRLAEQELMANYPGRPAPDSRPNPELQRLQGSSSNSAFTSPQSGSSRLPPEEEDPDSVAALKRRQQQLVTLSTEGYDYGASSSRPVPTMHTDSGYRMRPEDMDELPPMYTPS